MSEEQNRPWYLLTGLVIGLLLGLFISLKAAPVHYSETAPDMLAERYRADYRRLIALAYLAEGDGGRAQQRMALLKDSNPAQALSSQAQLVMANDKNLDEARALAKLGGLYEGVVTPVIPTQTATRATPPTLAPGVRPSATLDPALAVRTPTFTPPLTATSTPAPVQPQATATLRATLPAVFHLISQQEVCDPDKAEGLVQVEVLDENGRPLPGVAVTVTWQSGKETFYTGLYPEISPGYADFVLERDLLYSFTASEGSPALEDVQAPVCTDSSGGSFLGGWSLKFSQ